MKQFSVVVVTWVFSVCAGFSQTTDLKNEKAGYVGSERCISCHETVADTWSGSHHALAWTEPSPETVLADFDGTDFRHNGTLYEFSESDGLYRIEITEQDGTKTRYSVHSVAGVAPLQQYIIETEPGRLQSFDVVWDVDRKRWYHLYPDQYLPPDDGLHWTGPYKNWNARCAECHATGFEKNYDPALQLYFSTQAEIGVGCEACHGPASEHVEWAETNNITRIQPVAGYGFTMDFKSIGTEHTIQQCASCHSRREPMEDGNPLPGTPYHNAYTLALLRPGSYHADGQILDEVYVYGSFLQSKMYKNGVGCLDCHNAHSTELKSDENTLCTQCHSPAGNTRFDTLNRTLYDDPSHHFHESGTQGAACKSCHMIERVYMGIDGRRDHSFRIPRPDLAEQTDSPDACTDCHADRTPTWAAAEIAKRHPTASQRTHYGTTLAAGRADPVAARSALTELSLDTGQPDIVRATALWLLAQGADEQSAFDVAPLLADDDPLVRAAAIDVQNAAPAQLRAQRVVGLLADPTRLVRIETAKALLNAPIARLPERIDAQMRAAMLEWQVSLRNRLDFPETHMILGGMALTMRNIPAAQGAFRQTVALDPQREEAWVMLVRVAAASGDRAMTLDVLEDALEALPRSPALLELQSAIGAEQ